jgi:hypothetical protein
VTAAVVPWPFVFFFLHDFDTWAWVSLCIFLYSDRWWWYRRRSSRLSNLNLYQENTNRPSDWIRQCTFPFPLASVSGVGPVGTGSLFLLPNPGSPIYNFCCCSLPRAKWTIRPLVQGVGLFVIINRLIGQSLHRTQRPCIKKNDFW